MEVLSLGTLVINVTCLEGYRYPNGYTTASLICDGDTEEWFPQQLPPCTGRRSKKLYTLPYHYTIFVFWKLF